jgi:hypothetical protein
MPQYDMAYDRLHVDVYSSVFVMEDYESQVIVQNRATTWQHGKHIQQNHNFPNVSQGLSYITANEWKGYVLKPQLETGTVIFFFC